MAHNIYLHDIQTSGDLSVFFFFLLVTKRNLLNVLFYKKPKLFYQVGKYCGYGKKKKKS